jgi:hypothetical protein
VTEDWHKAARKVAREQGARKDERNSNLWTSAH